VLPEPTTTEWFAAAAAAGLIVALGGLHLIRPAAVPGTTTAGRLAGWLLGCLTVSAILVTAVLVGAGIRAAQITMEELENGTRLPSGAFARYLFDADPDSTERVAQYGPAVLLPLAGTLGVLALAAVDVGRSIGLRAIAVATCVLLAAVAVLIGLGDAGPLATRTAVAVAGLSTAAVAALAADHLRGVR
jgi:hypothetical protein